MSEGLFVGVLYKLAVSIGFLPDLRFDDEEQDKIQRPADGELTLDVVLALPDNLEIVGSAWGQLVWPAKGPSQINPEFLVRPLVRAPARFRRC